LAALGLTACADAPPVALRVGPIAYAEEELGALSPERRRDLATLAGFGAAVAADRLGDLLRPAVAEALDSATLGRLLDEVALRRSGLSADAVRAAYHRRPEVELTVRHLVVLADEHAPAGVAATARAKAVVGRNRVLAGEDFGRVAGEISEEPGARRSGGLLDPGRRGDWVEPFWRAALGLQPGEVSEVVRTRYGFHVLRLENRRVLPLEEVRRDVAGRLLPGDHAAAAARVWADSVTAAAAGDGDAALLREAERKGLGPTDAERDRARADAERTALGWAAALGFARGAEAEEVKRRAMEALASERQGVALARAEVLGRADLVRELYPEAPASSSEAVQADSSG
jgi:hypothetical protein